MGDEFLIQIRDIQSITKFMNWLALQYTAEEFKGLWRSMERFIRKFGRHFIADEISHDYEAVSVSLWKDYKGIGKIKKA